MSATELTQNTLKSVLRYDPDTGDFTWLVSKRGLRRGTPAKALRPDGYARITIGGRMYYSHRLAFLYMTGSWPYGHVDHANGVTGDNRWSNLRDATAAQNHANSIRTNPCGLKGVSRIRGKWRATISVAGRATHLGVFDTPEEAHAAFAIATTELHGEFARVA